MAETQPDHPKFGKALVSHSLSVEQMVVWVVLGVIFLGVPLVGFVMVGGKGLSPAMMLAGLVFGAMGLMLIFRGIIGVARGSERKTFYEKGVRVSRGGRDRDVAYVDVDVRYFITNSPNRSGERVIEVFPRDGSEVIRAGSTLAPLKPATKYSPSVEQIEHLRDTITTAVGQRMLAEVSQGKTVPWAGGVSLSRQGVVIESLVIPWADTSEEAHQSSGRYELFRAGEKKPVVRLKMIDLNFIPGWRVVRYLRERTEGDGSPKAVLAQKPDRRVQTPDDES